MFHKNIVEVQHDCMVMGVTESLSSGNDSGKDSGSKDRGGNAGKSVTPLSRVDVGTRK